ncbi:FAD binding domain-containing protein [Rhodococcoides kyotonense]|uniref:Carbon-monoxide dehydrogenase medium subunit n=1 Tax=Rhodococcoides kyotonense TaxID=398843 RepID=A0A239IQH0_9NOCA|nr:FAD binding domain-containing protein [Rhodococcus kyotonensis]SNS96026.1 carbon-monoxide dehydrogenase medium subunit [Rhodococcus kyotonensis]
MKPSPLTYHRPTTVEEACRILSEVSHEGKVMAGGQSLVPLLSMRLAAPAHIVDIGAVRDLDAVTVSPEAVEFGALVTHSALYDHAEAREVQPLLSRGLNLVAHPTIRNRGTTVGSIVHADPSAEMPAVLSLLGGQVTVTSVRGHRVIDASDLFAGPLESTLESDEIALSVSVPSAREGVGTAIDEIARRHGDYALVGVVAQVEVVDGYVLSARMTYISAGELGTVVDYSDALAGASATDERDPLWRAVGDIARDTIETDADIHATAAYRSQLVSALTSRVGLAAARDARTARALVGRL